MNVRIGIASVLPLGLALAVLLVLAGFGVVGWVVPISVAIALMVLALLVGWRTRHVQPRG